MKTTKMCRRLIALAGLAAIAASASALSVDPEITIDRALNSPTLAVRYAGVSATLVELRVNGESVGTREVSGGRKTGETSFTIDLDALRNGDNLVEIRLFDRTGKLVAQDKTNISVEKGARGPVFVAAPKAGATVMGPVAVQVGFGENLSKSYVSFFVDGAFKSMTNFPPFDFVWDTEKETNGWHEIEAWAIDASNETHKTGAVRLFVNNPGGRTDRVGNVAAIVPTRNVVRSMGLVGAEAGVRAIGGAAVGRPAKGAAPQGLPPAVVERMAPIGNALRATVSGANAVRPLILASGLATGPKSLVPTGRRVAIAKVVKPVVPAVPAVPVPPKTTSVVPTAPVAPVAPVAVTISAAPPVKMHVATGQLVVPSGPAVRASVAIAASTSLVAISHGTALPNLGAFAVVMDGQKVRFDVAPRVDDGLALAPLRNLIEKAGGHVEWEHATKTVHAGAGGHTMVLKIGGTTARVDGQNLVLEKAPGLSSDRTLVPLSFLRDALGMDVQYDKASGNVLVSTK